MIWLTAVACSLLLAGLWGWAGWQKWGGDPATQRDPMATLVYTALAGVATVVIVPVVFFQIRAVRALATRGVTTQGRVENISVFGKYGKSPTTVAYTVDGREYRIRRDMIRARVAVGGAVTILYDPQKPKRCDTLE